MDKEKLQEVTEETKKLFNSYKCNLMDVKSIFIAIELNMMGNHDKRD